MDALVLTLPHLKRRTDPWGYFRLETQGPSKTSKFVCNIEERPETEYLMVRKRT